MYLVTFTEILPPPHSPREFADRVEAFAHVRERCEEINGAVAGGMDRKRIFEAASSYLSHSAETSFIWTTNPIALAKLFKERDHEAAALEFRRLAVVWKRGPGAGGRTCLEVSDV